MYTLKPLDYPYNALEPFIDETTMLIHHAKHYQTYIDNLNKALSQHPDLKLSLVEMLNNPELIPADIRQTVINNGGGVYNHELFFSLLRVNQDPIPKQLLKEIIATWGSFENFKTAFTQAALTRFGSGWAWLIKAKDGLLITSTANQDTPLALGKPILAIDVWEHAYYLKYQNQRAKYIENFFNIINWQVVEELLTA